MTASVPSAPIQPTTTPIPEGRITIRKGDPTEQHYPKAETHAWGEFAGLAIEMGGYGDISAVNPYTGDRLYLFEAFDLNADDDPKQFTNAVRALMDAIDQHPEFLSPIQDGTPTE